MITLVKPTAVQAHLKEGNLVRLEKCVSGVLGRHPLYRRLALATEPAFTRLEEDKTLQSALLEKLQADGEISFLHLARADFTYYRYNGKTFGLHEQDDQAESDAYSAAEAELYKYAKGAHRRIFLGTWGVRSPQAVEELPPHLYDRLLIRIANNAQDPTYSRTSAVELTDAPFDQIRSNENGSQIFVASLPQLEKEEGSSKLIVGTNTFLPEGCEPEAGKEPNVFRRFWDWLRRRD